jgi:hypothetical protein
VVVLHGRDVTEEEGAYTLVFGVAGVSLQGRHEIVMKRQGVVDLGLQEVGTFVHDEPPR